MSYNPSVIKISFTDVKTLTGTPVVLLEQTFQADTDIPYVLFYSTQILSPSSVSTYKLNINGKDIQVTNKTTGATGWSDISSFEDFLSVQGTNTVQILASTASNGTNCKMTNLKFFGLQFYIPPADPAPAPEPTPESDTPAPEASAPA